jgi:hypothetical protein
MKMSLIIWRNKAHCAIADVILRGIDGSGSVGYERERGSMPALLKPAIVVSPVLSRRRN